MAASFRTKRWCRFLAYALIGLAFVGCTAEKPASNSVRVEDLRYRLLPGGARILTGSFVNDGASVVEVAQIEVSLFDDDNRRVSSMFVLVQNVEVNSSKDFREAVDVNLNVNGARVRGIIIP